MMICSFYIHICIMFKRTNHRDDAYHLNYMGKRPTGSCLSFTQKLSIQDWTSRVCLSKPIFFQCKHWYR